MAEYWALRFDIVVVAKREVGENPAILTSR